MVAECCDAGCDIDFSGGSNKSFTESIIFSRGADAFADTGCAIDFSGLILG